METNQAAAVNAVVDQLLSHAAGGIELDKKPERVATKTEPKVIAPRPRHTGAHRPPLVLNG